MFEEVPRTRRGLARLTARHVVLGPFVVGGGVLLAAIGGSVAVAATVITASSLHASDVPPHPTQRPVVAASTFHAAQPHQRPADRTGQPAATNSSARPPSSPPNSPPVLPAGPSAVSSTPPVSISAPSSTGPVRVGQPSTGQPSASPSNSANGPAGNALIYVTGFSTIGQRLQYEYASVSRGAGPNGSDLYRVSSSRQYSVALAADLTITSGSRLCPPAGSRCSVDQLAAAAGTGFYAVAAIDPADRLHSIIEVDNAGTGFAAQSSPTHSPPTQSSSPQSTDS